MKHPKGYVLFKSGNTFWELIMKSYPEYPWQPWKFPKISNSIWRLITSGYTYFQCFSSILTSIIDEKYQRGFVEFLEGKLNIEKPNDWLRVTKNDIQKVYKNIPLT